MRASSRTQQSCKAWSSESRDRATIPQLGLEAMFSSIYPQGCCMHSCLLSFLHHGSLLRGRFALVIPDTFPTWCTAARFWVQSPKMTEHASHRLATSVCTKRIAIPNVNLSLAPRCTTPNESWHVRFWTTMPDEELHPEVTKPWPYVNGSAFISVQLGRSLWSKTENPRTCTNQARELKHVPYITAFKQFDDLG